MCGIVAAISNRNVSNILLRGLERLEYRGYDSAGLALINRQNKLAICKSVGKVNALVDQLKQDPIQGHVGIAHTRWATHGKPTLDNAHPHHAKQRIALVHNGIIENYLDLKKDLIAQGYRFISETDTEVLVHLIHHFIGEGLSLFKATEKTINKVKGAFGLAVIDENNPHSIVAARSGSPLLIGLGVDENFIASDYLALRQVTDRFIYLEEGDIVEIEQQKIAIYNQGKKVHRQEQGIVDTLSDAGKGQYKHYMLKEIYEQPNVIQQTLDAHITHQTLFANLFTQDQQHLLQQVQRIVLVACGTSFHAALIGKYWLEEHAQISCEVEIASEFRYRKSVVQADSLLITLSQSGETADTLAALRYAKATGFLATMAICNVPTSSLVREAGLFLLTQAGAEIGVASTKAFTTQLTLLLLLTGFMQQQNQPDFNPTVFIQQVKKLPLMVDQVLAFDKKIERLFQSFSDKQHSLFLGRGIMYPVAMEGALKLKEVSYIHAEAYAAGELKHGPLALVDADMPIVAVAPSDELLEKIKSNLEEVQARGGHLFVITDHEADFNQDTMSLLVLPKIPEILAPIIYSIPLQLLSYHVAVLKGTDVDQPRNLAKSVTVE